MANNSSSKNNFSRSVKHVWRKLAGGVGKTYGKTMQKAEDTLEANRIRSRIRALDRLNTALYAKIGMEVYRSAKPLIARDDFVSQIRQIEKNYALQQELLLKEALLKVQQPASQGDCISDDEEGGDHSPLPPKNE